MPTSIVSPEVQAVFAQARLPQTKRVAVGDTVREIPTPFPSPEDWRDQWIYFLLVDRFNNPQAPPRFTPFDGLHGSFQGGTFNGVRQLVDEAHARGMYVIFDIVLNHAGDVFEYVLADGSRSAEAEWRESPYTINWRDENGQGRSEWATPPDNPPLDAAVWPAELRRNEFFRRQGKGGEAGGDFASLKEWVTAFQQPETESGPTFPVRNILIRAYQYLIAKYDVDGFRIDTLKYIEPEFAQVFGNAMREFALSLGKKNFFTFGEVYDNEEQIARFIGRNVAAQDTDLVGVDAALDFPLFFKLPGVAKGQLAPAEVIALFEHRKQVERDILSSHGEASRYFVTFLDNHDQRERFYFSPPDEPTRFGVFIGVAGRPESVLRDRARTARFWRARPGCARSLVGQSGRLYSCTAALRGDSRTCCRPRASTGAALWAAIFPPRLR